MVTFDSVILFAQNFTNIKITNLSIICDRYRQGRSQDFNKGGAQPLPVRISMLIRIYTNWVVTARLQSGEVHKWAMTKSGLAHPLN